MEYLKKFRKNELLTASLILIVLINLGNVFSYLFQFAMARMLGPADYGILAVLTNILYIFSIPTFSIQTIVSKCTTKFKVKKEFGRIKGVLKDLVKRFFIVAFISFLIFLLLSKFLLVETLGISFWLLALTGLYLFGAFIYPIGTGILQGMKKFAIWGGNSIINNGIKFFLGVLLVFAGFKVYAAILGYLFGILIAFVFIFPFIKEILKSKEIKEKTRIFSPEIFSTFLAMLFIVFLYSVDVFFAKMFFSAELAGKYAVASMIGKIILFGTMAIGNAMFPISSEKFDDGKGTKNLIRKTALIMALLCGFSIIMLLLIPEFIVFILFGSQYISIAGIMVYVGTAFSFISFMNILILYRISIDEFKMSHIILVFVLLAFQISSFLIFHKTIEQFSIAFMLSAMIIFILGFIFIRKRGK